MKETNARGYYIIEPPIYDKLDWNMDLIISCLNVIRHKMPDVFSEFPKSIEYYLISLVNPHGEPYPVIGIYSENEDDLQKLPDFIEMYDRIKHWIEQIEISELIKESTLTATITWRDLKLIGSYPK